MDSVRERIMKNIQAALEAITVENGYANTLNAVERFLQSGQSSKPPMALVIEGDDRPIDATQQDSGGIATERTFEVGVGIMAQQDEEADARSAAEVMNSLIADVQRAMQLDVTFGTYAMNSSEIGISAIEAEEGQPVLHCGISYEIRYRHLRTNSTVEV